MNTISKHTYCVVVALMLQLLSISLFGQVTTYPVQVYTQLTAPYTPYVPSYYSGGQEKLRVTLLNLDMQQPSLQVYLRMSIISSSFSLTTPVQVYTPTLELQAGIPLILSRNDLEPYFKKQNLRISGGQSEFYRTQMLPDNFYRFHFEVFELNTNRLLSNSRIGFAQAMITAGDPPILNLPLKGSVVLENNIPNIMFTWTPRHMTSVAAAYGTEYEFTLVEIQDKQANPLNAFEYSRVLYTETTRSTSFIHTAAQPMLIPGMRYGWRVRAIAREGLEEANVFKNNGFSQVFWFDYKGNCPVVTTSGVITQRTEARISWEPTSAIDYVLEYRREGSSKWYTGVVSGNTGKIYSLKPGETYEYRIGSRCYANDLYDYSAIKAFTLPAELAKSANCGVLPDLNLKNQTPAISLQAGLPILASDFPVFITQVTGSGSFSGEGYVGIPFIEGFQVAVTFRNIVVNTDNQLISGFFETKYDESNNNMLLDLDQVLTGGKGVGDIRGGDEKAAFLVDYNINPNVKAKPIKEDGSIDDIAEGKDYTFTKNENGFYEFVIVDDQGKEHKVKTETMPVTIEDGTGSTFEVNDKGTVSKVSGASDTKLDDSTKNELHPDIVTIQFRETPNSRYALDTYKEAYMKVTEYNDQYRIGDSNNYASAKFMLAGTTDEVEAFIESRGKKSSDFATEKVRFITGKGREYESKYNASSGTWTISVTGGAENDGQELYAVQDLGGGKTQTLGKLNIYTYPSLERSVTLVSVNGAKSKQSIQSIESELNRIYGKIGITWKVNILDTPFNYTLVNGSTFNVTGSGLMSTLTNDMKAINEAFKGSGEYQEDGLYLFVLPYEASDKGEVNGTGGDMPLGSQFGYLFSDAGVSTIAHELGHGAFNLEHPFSRPGRNSFQKGALENNLMDYTSGTEFAKLQWDQTRAPGMVIGLFQKDKDGMSDRVKDINVFLKWLKDNIGNENVSYNQNSFYDGHVVFDHAIKVKDLGITLYIDFGKSGNLNLGKTETGGIPAFGVDFELDNKYHNGFYFKIRYKDQTGDAIKIWFYSYEHFASFMSYLGIKINDPVKDHLITLYKELIEKAGNDCDKLDVIYETIPDFVAKAIPDETLYKNMESLGGCSIGNYNWKRLWWGATDEVQALINILNGFDQKWIYQKINNSPDFFEKLLREKVGVRANSIDKFILTISQIAAENWGESDLVYQDCIIIGGQKINVTNDYEKLYRLGVSGQLNFMEQSVFVNGCCPTQIGSYNFGNQILIENPMFAAGSIFGCTNHIQKKSLAPIYILQDADEDLILPAVVAKYLLEDASNKAFWEIVNLHLGLLMPEVLIKPATLTKWSKFLKGKGASQATKVSDDVVKAFTNRLNSSIAEETGFTQIHSKDEITKIITKGRELGLSDNVIEDLLYISCRDAKSVKANDLMQQMDNYVNVVLERGYPYKFNSKAEFDKFKGELKKGLDDIGISTADVRIQGSSLRTPSANDVDLVVFLDEISFNRAIINRFSNRITKNNQKIDLTNKSTQELIEIADDYQINRSLYNNQTDSFSRAMKGQKFSAYSNDKIVPKLTDLYKQLKQKYPELNIENISVQTVNTSFDLNPFIKL